MDKSNKPANVKPIFSGSPTRFAIQIPAFAFFMKHLEDEDESLARDSYDEFAVAPYEDLKGLVALLASRVPIVVLETRDEARALDLVAAAARTRVTPPSRD